MAFTQLLINGLVTGGMYVLVASGFAFIYTTNRFIHFAHGATVMVAAYLFYFLISRLNLPLPVSAMITVLCASLFGFLMHFLVYLPLKKRGSSSTILLIAGIGLMIFFSNLMQLIAGSDVKILSVFQGGAGFDFLGARITTVQILIIVTVFVLAVLLYFFTRKSKLGRLMKAVSDNPFLAQISGINSTNIQHWSFIIGSFIAGIAAILISLENNIEPTMGANLMIVGFSAAVIGGVTSLIGPIFGGLMIGMIENFGAWFIPAGYKSAIIFSLLLIFLIIRPQGIFGINKGTRE